MKLKFSSVRSVVVQKQYRQQTVPHKATGFWDRLTRGYTKDVVLVEDLPDLYLDGRRIGRLHGLGKDEAEVVREHLAALRGQPVDLILLCRPGSSSGLWIDRVHVLRQPASRVPSKPDA